MPCVAEIELIPWLLTFVLCLLIGVEYGIIVGIGVSLLMLLGPSSRPKVKVVDGVDVSIDFNLNDLNEESDRRIIVLNVEHGLQFPGMEYFKDKVAEKAAGFKFVIVDFSHVSRIDYTTVESIHCLITEAMLNGSKIVFCNPRADILQQFKKAKLEHFLHADSIDAAVQLFRDTANSGNNTTDAGVNQQQSDRLTAHTPEDVPNHVVDQFVIIDNVRL